MKRNQNVLHIAAVAACIGLAFATIKTAFGGGPAMPPHEALGVALGAAVSFGLVGAVATIARNRLRA